MLARTLNMLIGQWLILSAFIWHHDHAQRVNAVVVGLVCSAIAFHAVTHPAARRWNVALAGWLLVSTVVMPHGAAATWNNVVVALAMVALALVRSPEVHRALTLEERLRIVADGMSVPRPARSGRP